MKVVIIPPTSIDTQTASKHVKMKRSFTTELFPVLVPRYQLEEASAIRKQLRMSMTLTNSDIC
jgi:hypothetical protein